MFRDTDHGLRSLRKKGDDRVLVDSSVKRIRSLKNGEVWTGSMLNDRVARLDPKTDQIVEYLLPRSTNIRRVFVDDSGARPALWVGSNHGASIVKVEPLD